MTSLDFTIPFIAFGVLAVYGVSRLLLFLSKMWDGGYIRIVVANALSGAICITVFGLSKGWHPLWVLAVVMFGPAQFVVLLIDIWNKFKVSRASDT